ncbi:MAG: DUF805 domain-containing protein [Pseudomonadota bacterium]
MTLGQSIITCFRKYFVFSGRATRSEFWWFMLFRNVLISVPLSLISVIASDTWNVVTVIPCLSAGARRLHDMDRSGWWQALPLASLPVFALSMWLLGEQALVLGPELVTSLHGIVLVAGGVVLGLTLALLIYWWATPGTQSSNRFGDDPMGASAPNIFD